MKKLPAKKAEINHKVSGRGLMHKKALEEDVRVAKVGSTPRKWSSKAK